MAEVKDKVEFPRHVTIGDKSFSNVWVGVQEGKAFLYHYNGQLVECLVDGVEIASWDVNSDSSLSDEKKEAHRRLRKQTNETVVRLADGSEFTARTRGGCGCSNPLKRAKNLAQVKDVQVKKQTQFDSKKQRAERLKGKR